MKYLKLFEGFSTEDYYVELTPAEHDDLCENNYWRWNSNTTFGNDAKRLIKILVDNDLDPSVYNGIKWVKWEGKDIKIESIRCSSNKVVIYPLLDDYYLVEYQDEYYEMKFYKCDQIDGVIRLLKDLDVI
jgi:phage protein U